MVQRNGNDVVVPTGDYLLLEDDKVIILNIDDEENSIIRISKIAYIKERNLY